MQKLSKIPIFTSFSSVFTIVLVIVVFLLSSFFLVKKVVFDNKKTQLTHEYLVSKDFAVSANWLSGASQLRDHQILVESDVIPIVYASSLSNPVQFISIPDLNSNEPLVVVLEQNFGNLVVLEDSDGDGAANSKLIYETNLNMPWGLYYYNNDLYVAEKNQIVRYKDFVTSWKQKTPTKKEVLISPLPALSGSDNKNIVVKNDTLYVSYSASCEGCLETDLRRSTITTYDLNTKKEQIYARGLKNVSKFAPDKNVFYVVDNKNNDSSYVINAVKQGEDYTGVTNFLQFNKKDFSPIASISIFEDYIYILSGKRIFKSNLNSNSNETQDVVEFDTMDDFDLTDIQASKNSLYILDKNGLIYNLKKVN